jgi:hypothetical protein
MIVCFELSMPSVGSWNGKWSGENKRYIIRKTVRSESDIKKALSLIGYHHYSFGDGWAAGINIYEIEKPKTKIVDKYKKNGFCGYEWMVRSLWNYGKIMNDLQIEDMNEQKKQNEEFKEYILNCDYPILEAAIYWIQNNLLPEDVFSSSDLESCANNLGFRKEE